MNYVPEFEIMVSCIFMAYLAWVSWQDYREMQVVRYSHGLGLLAIVLGVFLQKAYIWNRGNEYFLAFLVLLLTQSASHWLKLYGLADAIVFFLCGLFFLVQGGTEVYLLAYVMLQAISGGLLFVVQTVKRNRKGLNLKHAVPYIPYIYFAFILTNVVL